MKMEDAECSRLIQSLDDLRKFLGQERREPPVGYESANALHSLELLRKDAESVARMASQALEHQDLTIVQQISLKSSLSKLEYELRLLKHAFNR